MQPLGLRGYVLVHIVCFGLCVGTALAGQPAKREQAGSERIETYTLSEKNGPWMIYVASFAGPTAEDEAIALVEELRNRFRSDAYIHTKKFDLSEPIIGKGFDKFGNPKKMRHQSAVAFDEYAVMVGNYETFEDPNAHKHLEMLKYCQPKCLNLNDGTTQSLRFAGLRAFHKAVQKSQKNEDKKTNRGPLGQAFITRNPLLPDEYFTPKGVDKLVASMNEGVTNSLLDCPGEYTVRVATFRGAVTIDQDEIKRLEETNALPSSKLAQAADKAHRLTELLRAKGVEAYEFHDRHESIVTVGNFATVGSPRQDGKIEINPAMYKVIEKFSPRQQAVPSSGSQPMAGLVPLAMGGIPFDIQPLPVKVPRRSIATDYVKRGGAVR